MPRDRRAIPRLMRSLALAAGALMCASAPAQVLQDRVPAEEAGADLVDRVGERVPLNLAFTEADAAPITMADVFDDGLPVVLALVYYECPLVCTVVMDRMAESFAELDYVIGRDFNVLVVSFDPRETPTQALATKQSYLGAYEKAVPETADGWSFCVADARTIEALSASVGFKTKKMPDGEYAHPVAIMILSPEGVISRYMVGFEYPPRDMKLALLEASEGKISRSVGDWFLHYCYRYDPDAGSYSADAMAIMRIGGVLTVIGLVILIGGLFVGERVRRRLAGAKATRAGATGDPGVPSRGRIVTGGAR